MNGNVEAQDQYVCKLSPQLIKKAKDELGETADKRDKGIQIMREWLRNNQHLNADTSAAGILRFLRTCKYNIEDSKKRMEMYYTMKSTAPEFYSNWDPRRPEVQSILNKGVFLPLNQRDSEGNCIILLRAGVIDTSKTKIDEIVKTAMMVYALLLKETENLQICGQVMLMDLNGISTSHLYLANPVVLKKAIKCWQDCSPSRVKAVHYYKSGGIFQAMFKVIHSLLKEKMRKRHHLHGDNLESVHAHISKSVLPKEYGGTAGPVSQLIDQWKVKMEDNRDWLMQQEKFRANSEKDQYAETDMKSAVLGMRGSFKKLEID